MGNLRYRTLKPITIPESVVSTKPPRPKTAPKAENTDPKIPKFSVAGLYIQGKEVGSVLEWNIASALDELELGYRYQVSVLGGRMRGGSVVDFDVFTRPQGTFIFAQGDYWHTRDNKEDEDLILFARIEAVYNKRVVQIWEHDALTVQMAVVTLRKELRV